MKHSSRWNAELIVACLAVAIGVYTVLVYIFQARTMNKQRFNNFYSFNQ